LRLVDADALTKVLRAKIADAEGRENSTISVLGTLGEEIGLRKALVSIYAALTLSCETCDLNPPCKRGELAGCAQWKARRGE
jgi:hypothetical protein